MKLRGLRRGLLYTGILILSLNVIFGTFLATPAEAQAPNYQTVCQNPSNQISLNASFGSAGLALTQIALTPMKVDYQITIQPVFGTTVRETSLILYRATARDRIYSQIEAKSITLSAQGSNWVASGSMTNDPPVGSYTYFLQVKSTIGSANSTKCSNESQIYQKSNTTNNSGSSGSSSSTADDENELRKNYKKIDGSTAGKWFEGSLGQYQNLETRDNGDKPPTLILPASSEQGRPELSFELLRAATYIDGRANINAVNRGLASTIGDLLFGSTSNINPDTWLEAIGGYFTDSYNNTIFTWSSKTHNLLAKTDTDGNLEFFWVDTDKGVVKQLRGSLAPNWANDAVGSYEAVEDGPYFSNVINKVFRENIDDCENAQPTKYPDVLSGDKSYKINDKPSPKCLYTEADGWLAKWGVEVVDVAGDEGCKVSVLSTFTKGIGEMLLNMVGCIFGWIFDNVITTLEGWFVQIGQQSYLPPSSDELVFAKILGVQTVHAQVNSAGYEGELNSSESVIVRVWRIARSVVNIFVIVALIAIAFANILHLNINTYAAKKALPGIIIGVIGANASLLIMRFLADMAQALSYFAVELSSSNSIEGMFGGMIFALGKSMITPLAVALVGGAAAVVATGGAALPVLIIGGLIILLYYAFLLIAFAFAMLKRLVILYMLSMAAPLAFASYGLPQTQHYFFKWWNMYLTYLFLFPIILIGMAVTMIISQELKLSQLQPFTTAGIVGLALVWGAATITLKLPKILTKGAIDVGAMFKKVLSQAPKAAQGIQNTHKFVYGGGYQKFRGNMAKFGADSPWLSESRRAALKAQASTHFDDARKQKLDFEKNNKARKKFASFTGYSTLFGDPSILQGSLEERMNQMAKERKIAALTKTGRLPGKIRGGAAEAPIAKGLAQNEVKDAGGGRFGLLSWREGLGAGHIGAVYGLKKDDDGNFIPDPKKTEEDNLMTHMWRASGGDQKKFEAIRDRFRTIGSEEAMLEFIEGERNEQHPELGGLGIASRWDIHDLMKIAGYEGEISAEARRVKNTEAGIERGDDFMTQQIKKREVIDPLREFRPDYDPAGGGGGGGNAGGDDDDEDMDGAFGTPNHAQHNAEEIAQGINNYSQELFKNLGRIGPHLSQELENEILESFRGLDLNNEETAERLRTALMNAAGGNPETGDDLTERIFEAQGDKLESLAKHFIHTIEASRRGGTPEAAATVARDLYDRSAPLYNQASEVTANIDLNELGKVFSEALAANNPDLGQAMASHLESQIQQLTTTLNKNYGPETLKKVAQEINKLGADKIREIFTSKDPRSVSNLLAKAVSKAHDEHIPSPDELIVNVQQTPPADNPTSPPPTQS